MKIHNKVWVILVISLAVLIGIPFLIGSAIFLRSGIQEATQGNWEWALCYFLFIIFLIFAGVAMVVGLYVLAIGRNWKGSKDVFLDEHGIYTLSGKKKELDIGWDEIVEAEITMPRTRQGRHLYFSRKKLSEEKKKSIRRSPLASFSASDSLDFVVIPYTEETIKFVRLYFSGPIEQNWNNDDVEQLRKEEFKKGVLQ